MKEKDWSCFGLVFAACSVFGRFFQVSHPGVWKILPNTKQAAKTKPKQVFFFHFSSFLTVYLLLKCHFQENFGLCFSNWQIRRTLVCVSAVADSANFGLCFSNWQFRKTLICISAADDSGELWSFQENFGLCFSSWQFRRTLVRVSTVDDSGELWSVFRQLTIQENFVFQQLTIQENSPGKDGMEYKLSCKVSCPLLPRNHSIPSYDIPFLFYNGELSELAWAVGLYLQPVVPVCFFFFNLFCSWWVVCGEFV